MPAGIYNIGPNCQSVKWFSTKSHATEYFKVGPRINLDIGPRLQIFLTVFYKFIKIS